MTPPPQLLIRSPRPASAREKVPTPQRTLWRLFLTLFLRGRSGRTLKHNGVPRSIFSKLWLTIGFYALFGLSALLLRGTPILVLSLYLHGTTFVLIGMLVAASSGDMLFNTEEADILMHRPITSRALLWAKVAVLVQLSLWLAGAYNAAGFVVGAMGPGGTWRFIPVHALSTALAALFCTSCVVVTYQLCLRWFGRERLDGVMTMSQVALSVLIMLGAQLVPRLLDRFGDTLKVLVVPWWARLLPPAWFAGMDDALAGSGARSSWELAAIGLGATALVVWLAFGKLAADYGDGIRAMNEGSSRPVRRANRRWIAALVRIPPVSWWMRDPVARASFVLTAAYLLRDRDTKLRVYPAVASMMVLPLIILIRDHGSHGSGLGAPLGVAFVGMYLGLAPLTAVDLVRYSAQWQAADLFRLVPMAGTGSLSHGARRAVLMVMALPSLVVLALLVVFLGGHPAGLALLIPGVFALPVFAMYACRHGLVPFAEPVDSTRATRRNFGVLGVMAISGVWAAIPALAWPGRFFWLIVLAQGAVCAGVYAVMRASVSRAGWARA